MGINVSPSSPTGDHIQHQTKKKSIPSPDWIPSPRQPRGGEGAGEDDGREVEGRGGFGSCERENLRRS